MKLNWWSSLRTKIIAWSFVPTAIILSAVAWFTFYSYQKVIGDLAIKQSPDIIQPKAAAFSDAFRALINPITVPIYLEIDNNPELPLDARVQNILDSAQGLEVFDGGIYFLDQHGTVIRTEGEGTEFLGQDWSDTPHFRSILERPNNTAFTDLIPVGSSGKKIFCFGQAMVGHSWDEVDGAYYICYIIHPDAQNFYTQTMSSLDLGANIRVLDRNHQILYSQDPTEMGKDLSAEIFMQQFTDEGIQSGRFQFGSEDVVISYIPLPGGPTNQRAWYMLSEQSWAEIMQPSLPYRLFLLALLALGVILPVLVTAYGVRQITDPIRKLIQASKQVTAGEFKQRIQVRTGDEIEILAEQFNLMSAELDDSYSTLEKKVADRTRELAILNSIISVASHSLNGQEILENALHTTVEQMGFESGVAFKLDPHSTIPHLVAQRGFEAALASNLVNIYVTGARGSQPIFPVETGTLGIEDLREKKIKSKLSKLGYRSLAYVPHLSKGQNLGFFILGKRDPIQPSPEELSLLISIGKQVGVALENANLFDQAEQTAITSERNRLARELHDAVTQTLFSANLIADVIPRIWKRNPKEGMQNLEELRQLTRGALAEMRTMLLEMRPGSLERIDLKPLLTQLADAFVGRARVPVSVVIQGECEIPHEVKIAFYRVAQEALNNIAKHSGARHVDLHLDCQPGKMNLHIKDDGLGFDPASTTPDHLGLAIMRERASSIGANLTLESQAGKGTTIDLDWRSEPKD